MLSRGREGGWVGWLRCTHTWTDSPAVGVLVLAQLCIPSPARLRSPASPGADPRGSSPYADPRGWLLCAHPQVLCWRDVTFGRHDWALPRCTAAHSDATERCAVFAAALLEGRVLPSLAGAGTAAADVPMRNLGGCNAMLAQWCGFIFPVQQVGAPLVTACT